MRGLLLSVYAPVSVWPFAFITAISVGLASDVFASPEAGKEPAEVSFEVSKPRRGFELEGEMLKFKRGESVFNNRDKGHCLLCHQLNANPEGFQGNLGPSLDGVAKRMSQAQLRSRIEDSRRYNPDTIMPPYFSVESRHQVAKEFVGKTVLTSEEIDDLVGYLIRVSN